MGKPAILNLTRSGGDVTATVQLHGEIVRGWEDAKSDSCIATQVAYEIQTAGEDNEVTNVVLDIDSIGGDVSGSYKILNAITNCPKPITGLVTGTAYSCAFWLLLACANRDMRDNAILMCHPLSGGGSSDQMDAFRESVTNVIAGNMGIEKTAAASMLETETWYSADTAKAANIIKNIRPSGQKPFKMAKNASAEKAMAVYNSYKETPNPTNMKGLNKVLNLAEEASPEATEAAVTKLKTDHDSYKERAETAETENKTLKEAAATAELTEKDAVLNKLVTDGKYTKEEIENLRPLPVANIKALGETRKVNKKTPDILNSFKSNATEGIPAGREKWGIKEWGNEDPEGLQNIMENEPDTFATIKNMKK